MDAMTTTDCSAHPYAQYPSAMFAPGNRRFWSQNGTVGVNYYHGDASTVTVKVYYNRYTMPSTATLQFARSVGLTEEDLALRLLFGFRGGDLVQHTFTLWMPPDERLCDHLWEYLNRDDRPNAWCERALSVGDVIEVLPTNATSSVEHPRPLRFACTPSGWSSVTVSDWAASAERYQQFVTWEASQKPQ